MQVDHIVPPSAFAKKKLNRRGVLVSNTSFLARAMNSSFNTVAICPTCNQKKSDKVGLVTARGVAAKAGETAVGLGQKAVGGVLFAGVKAAELAVKLAAAPLRKGSPAAVKAAYLILLAAIVIIFLVRG